MSYTPHLSNTFCAFLQTNPRIVLGSNSSSRKTILNEVANHFHFQYEVVAAGIDEKSIRKEDPKELVLALGYEKARAVVRKVQSTINEDTYIITCDQVVTHENRILEKPISAEEIRLNIRGFAQTPASTVGSVVCTHLPSEKQLHQLDIATIYMNHLPDESINQLIKEGHVFQSAGGLLAEHPLVSPHVTQIDGGLDAIMGLSKITVISLLIEMWNTTRTNNSH